MKPRIAICGIHIESSTFTPYISVESDFDVLRGEDLLRRYDWINDDWSRQVEWLPILRAGALPGGVVERSAYDGWKQEIVESLRALTNQAPLDGLYFDIHGAMSVEGMDDAEGDLITVIRGVIGSEPMVSASMDLHGNVSQTLFNGCDMMTCYRLAPHEDAWETRERGARNLVDRLVAGLGKPTKALAHVPVLLPGEKTSTRTEPAKGLYGMIPEIEARPGIIDASVWVGFAWSDQPRCKGAIVVFGDDTGDVATQTARLARAFWNAHDKFEFVAPVDSIEGCLAYAIDAPKPFFISDTGDNPGAGGADDVTVALAALLNWGPVKDSTLDVLYASILDPESASAAAMAGVGATVELSVGGKVDTRAPGPVQLKAEVLSVAEDPRGGTTVTLKSGGLTLIVTENRNQYANLEQYLAAGVDPRAADVVMVKIGYLEPDLYSIQADWKMALTPGGVDQDLVRLGHRHIDRPMFPFDQFSSDPAIRVEVVEP